MPAVLFLSSLSLLFQLLALSLLAWGENLSLRIPEALSANLIMKTTCFSLPPDNCAKAKTEMTTPKTLYQKAFKPSSPTV